MIKEFIKLNINDIKLNERNPRKNNKAVERVKRSLKDNEYISPIVIDENNKILAGNTRYKALKELNYQDIDCLKVTGLTDKQKKDFVVLDNKTNEIAEWNYEILLEDFERFELLDFGFDLLEIPEDVEKKEIEDDVPPITDQPKTVRGDIYQLGNHRLMCGDSVMINDINKLLDNNIIDLVYTDPPYGIEVVAGKYGNGEFEGKGIAQRGSYQPIKNDNSTQTAKDIYNILKSMNYNMIIWGGNYFTDFLPPSRCWIVWYKKENLPDDNFSNCELAYTNYDKNCKTISINWKGMIKQGEMGEKRIHPTQKPIDLAIKCFEYVEAGKNILDLFLGSGSTLIACEKTNRVCYGMELEETYCDLIIQRWVNYTGIEEVIRNGEKITWLKK